MLAQFLICTMAVSTSGGAGGEASTGDAFVYPEAPRDDTVVELHATKVPDPFRPLEDPDAPATKEWVRQQNVITDAYLARFADKHKIRKRCGRAPAPCAISAGTAKLARHTRHFADAADVSVPCVNLCGA